MQTAQQIQNNDLDLAMADIFFMCVNSWVGWVEKPLCLLKVALSNHSSLF